MDSNSRLLDHESPPLTTRPGANAINLFHSSVTTECWNNTLWLVQTSHLACSIQSGALMQTRVNFLLWNLFMKSASELKVSNTNTIISWGNSIPNNAV